MKSISFVHFCVYFIVLVATASLGGKSGPYEIIVDTISPCEDQGTKQFYFGSGNVNKTNGLFTSPFYVGVPIDDNFTGNFTARNMEFKDSPKKVPSIVYGRYTMKMDVYYNGVKVGCGMFSSEVVPKTN